MSSRHVSGSGIRTSSVTYKENTQARHSSRLSSQYQFPRHSVQEEDLNFTKQRHTKSSNSSVWNSSTYNGERVEHQNRGYSDNEYENPLRPSITRSHEYKDKGYVPYEGGEKKKKGKYGFDDNFSHDEDHRSVPRRDSYGRFVRSQLQDKQSSSTRHSLEDHLRDSKSNSKRQPSAFDKYRYDINRAGKYLPYKPQHTQQNGYGQVREQSEFHQPRRQDECRQLRTQVECSCQSDLGGGETRVKYNGHKRALRYDRRHGSSDSSDSSCSSDSSSCSSDTSESEDSDSEVSGHHHHHHHHHPHHHHHHHHQRHRTLSRHREGPHSYETSRDYDSYRGYRSEHRQFGRGTQNDFRGSPIICGHGYEQSPNIKSFPENITMADCNLIAAALNRPKKTPQDLLRELRVENSEENCVSRGLRVRECPGHSYSCNTYELPHPYTKETDLRGANVRYGTWTQSSEDDHCSYEGPCEREMGMCPIITRVKKHGRQGTSDESLFPAHYEKVREGTLQIPRRQDNNEVPETQAENQERARKADYYLALRRGDITFTARCGNKLGKCSYAHQPRHGGGYENYQSNRGRASNDNYDSSDGHGPDGNGPDKCEPDCIVRQCSFVFKTPQYFGVTKAPVNCSKEQGNFPVMKHLQELKSMHSLSVPAADECGCEKDTGKRKHRCGFPTLHAKSFVNNDKPFPHEKTWETENTNTLLDDKDRSESSNAKRNTASERKSMDDRRRSSGDKKSLIGMEKKQSSSVSSPALHSSFRSSVFQRQPVSLCADASCISSKRCSMSSSLTPNSTNSALLDQRMCAPSYASCKDLHRKISPDMMDFECPFPGLFACPVPRFPLPDTGGCEMAAGIVDTIVDRATGKTDDSRPSGSRSVHQGSMSSNDMYRSTQPAFHEMSTAWSGPWNHASSGGQEAPRQCTAADGGCRYKLQLRQPLSSSANRWPHYYGYLWSGMKTPEPTFPTRTCARDFRTAYLTSNYRQ